MYTTRDRLVPPRLFHARQSSHTTKSEHSKATYRPRMFSGRFSLVGIGACREGGGTELTVSTSSLTSSRARVPVVKTLRR